MLSRILIMAMAIFVTPALAQEKPNDFDSQTYKKAYELIFDSQARAKRAEQLLLDDGNRKLAELSAKELSLLCRVYNEVGNSEKQLAVAQELWSRFPENKEATNWMVNSLLNTMMKDKSAQETIDFVDLALKDLKGIRSELLVLKARAILQNSKKITDAERRVIVSDLLIEAYACHEKSKDTFDFPDLANVSFVDMDYSFSQYFSTVEREALKVRMQKARDAKK